MIRDPLAMAMFAAWANVKPDDVPREYQAHTCEATMAAWKRVADAARSHLAIDGNDLWEVGLGIMGQDFPEALNEEVCAEIASAINTMNQG